MLAAHRIETTPDSEVYGNALGDPFLGFSRCEDGSVEVYWNGFRTAKLGPAEQAIVGHMLLGQDVPVETKLG